MLQTLQLISVSVFSDLFTLIHKRILLYWISVVKHWSRYIIPKFFNELSSVFRTDPPFPCHGCFHCVFALWDRCTLNHSTERLCEDVPFRLKSGWLSMHVSEKKYIIRHYHVAFSGPLLNYVNSIYFFAFTFKISIMVCAVHSKYLVISDLMDLQA